MDTICRNQGSDGKKRICGIELKGSFSLNDGVPGIWW